MAKAAKKDGAVPDLTSIRERIDAVDRKIQELINERARYAQQVGISKGDLSSAVDYYRPEREAEVLRAVLERNEGPLRDEEMLRLFREIMSACLAQQDPLKISYLGPEGTFTQTAVYKHFGHSVRGLPFSTIDEVFQEVESGAADFGVVPIENSTEGTINHTLDMFLTSPLKIGGEVELRIEQHLLSTDEGLDSIERICAHEQSLAQCRGWLEMNLPDVPQHSTHSTAQAAERASHAAQSPSTARVSAIFPTSSARMARRPEGLRQRPSMPQPGKNRRRIDIDQRRQRRARLV